MKQQSFVDLLNKWVDNKSMFLRWRMDKEGINGGFPVYAK